MNIEHINITSELSETIIESIKISSPNVIFGEKMTSPLSVVTTLSGVTKLVSRTSLLFKLYPPSIMRSKAIIDTLMSNLPIELADLQLNIGKSEAFPYGVSRLYIVHDTNEIKILTSFGVL